MFEMRPDKVLIYCCSDLGSSKMGAGEQKKLGVAAPKMAVLKPYLLNIYICMCFTVICQWGFLLEFAMLSLNNNYGRELLGVGLCRYAVGESIQVESTYQ